MILPARTRIVLTSVLLALASVAVARGADVGPPIPAPRGFVTDEAGVLPADQNRTITALLTEVQQKTGAEIGILTLSSTQPLDDFDYATAAFDRWKLGKHGKDNGVLILVAVRDRKVRIITGYGLEGILPDGKVGEIIDTAIVPSLREGDYAAGILRGAWAIAQVIAADAGVTLTGAPPAEPVRAEPSDLDWVTPFAFIVLMILSAIMNALAPRRRHWWMGGGGGYSGGGGFGGGGGGGGFGGFGGGSTGGGGAGRGW